METKETELPFLIRTSKKQSFDKRLIAHIIGLIGQGVPRKSIVAEYKVCNETLSRWLRGDNSRVVSRKSYTTSEKRSVIRAIESGLSVKQAQIAFNISSPGIVRRWMKDFEKENVELSVPKPIEVAKKTSDTTEALELKVLKKALEEANLKIRALDTMIDIAEEQLKIDIRKKSGAKQSSK
jgi:transposase-like protein